VACLLLPSACAHEGDGASEGSDRKRTVLLSTEYDDLAVGEDASAEIEAEMGLYDSPALTAWVAEVGRRLVAFAPQRPFQYRFQIVDQMVPNAFSLPGGHIYVSRGLVALANSEAELAGVLGHEIIHAAERHAAAQQELARRTSPFLMPYVRMARLAAYSRDHERAADRGGQTIAARAGYDPAALAEFLKHLGDSERLTVGYSRLPSYFDTHPGTTERVATTASHAVTLEWTPDPTREGGRDAYLRQVDGIVLDTNPAEGIFRETEFIHPDLDFRILFPRGWTLVNTRQAVGAVSPDNNARIFITLEAPIAPAEPETRAGEAQAGQAGPTPGSEGAPQAAEPPQMPTAREAADRFVADPDDEFRIRVAKDQLVQIGEIEAPRIDFEGNMGPVSVGGQATFIPHGGLVLRLMSVATSGTWSQFVGRAHTSARTFRPLTEEERNGVAILHLRLASAMAGEDLAALGRRTGNAWGPGPTAVLNGVFVDARFEEGDLVKIAKSIPYTPRRDPLDIGGERPSAATVSP
jgi:predicted Zn-dependent protease